MEPEGSLPYSQVPDTCPILRQINPAYAPHPTSWRSILILSYLRLGLPSGLFPSGFPTKTLYTHPLSPPYVLYAAPILFFSIWLPEEYWVKVFLRKLYTYCWYFPFVLRVIPILCFLTLRWLTSYIYGAPILDVSISHTTTQHSR